jgi:hypothetical protein
MKAGMGKLIRLVGASLVGAALLAAPMVEAGVRLGGGGVRLGGGGVRMGGGGSRLTPPKPTQRLTYPSSRPICPPFGWGHPCYGLGVYGWPYWWYSYDNSTYDGPPMIEIVRRVDPAAAGVEGLPLPPPPDEGLVAMYDRDYARAVVVYAQRVADEGKGADRRLMALALIAARRFEEGAKAMREAYRAEASLSDVPLDGGPMVRGDMEWRRLVTSMVRHAYRAQSSDAWFSVGVLMQAEGRFDWARKMFERSEDRREREGNSGESGASDPAERPAGASAR